jgi:hypothetical protein
LLTLNWHESVVCMLIVYCVRGSDRRVVVFIRLASLGAVVKFEEQFRLRGNM